jgi:hypothetical protein
VGTWETAAWLESLKTESDVGSYCLISFSEWTGMGSGVNGVVVFFLRAFNWAYFVLRISVLFWLFLEV